MYQELSWYIDDNRFSNIVSQIEESAQEYSLAFDKNSEGHKEKRRKFHNLVLFHAKKSGYINRLGENFDIDGLFFAGNKINRKALNDFEKEIVKNHMYQKHLWDFMGTTGNFTLITKMALATKNKSLSELLPISFKKKHEEKSPISAILSDDAQSVPIYIYSDGSISTLYDKNKAQVQFNTTDDKSGFDWKMTGWDPNYTIEHSDLTIVYDSKNDCFVAKKKDNKDIKDEVVQIFTAEKAHPLSLKLIKVGRSAILYDPFYVFLYKKLKDILDSKEKLEDNEYLDEMLESIDLAMHNLGVETISAFVKSPSLNEKLEDDEVVSAYRKLLADRVAKDVKVISVDDARKAEEKSIDEAIKSREKTAGQSLGAKLGYLLSLGLTGKTLTSALETDSMMQPLDYRSKIDCEAAGLDDFEYEALKKYEMTDEQSEKFNHTLFNAYDNYALISTSGLTKSQLADLVYDRVVLGKKSHMTLNIDTTLERVCSTNSVIFDSKTISPSVRSAFEAAVANVPSEKRTPRLENAINNAVKRYNFIKESNGMSEQEVVNNLVVLFVDNLVPTSSITYINSSSATNQRLYVRLSADDMIDQLSSATTAKMAMKPIDYASIDLKSKYNLFDNADVSKMTKSAAFKKSGLEADTLLSLISKSKSALGATSALSLAPLAASEFTGNEVVANNMVANIYSDDILTPNGLKASAFNDVKSLNLDGLRSAGSFLSQSGIADSDALSTIGGVIKNEFGIPDNEVSQILSNMDLNQAKSIVEKGGDVVSNVSQAIQNGDFSALAAEAGAGMQHLVQALNADPTQAQMSSGSGEDEEDEEDEEEQDTTDQAQQERQDDNQQDSTPLAITEQPNSVEDLENTMALGMSNIAAAEYENSASQASAELAGASYNDYVDLASDMLDDMFSN